MIPESKYYILQALEKGSQGNNAKFTYSCDGHSASSDLNFFPGVFLSM